MTTLSGSTGRLLVAAQNNCTFILTTSARNTRFKLMLRCSKQEVIMRRTVKHELNTAISRESSFVSLLSGWVQQGVENFFATQRILVDLATRQNASAMHMLRERLADPAYCPTEILTELTGEGMTNFIEGQKLLLNLVQQEYELVTNGVKERVGGSPAATALTGHAPRFRYLCRDAAGLS